MSGHTPGPWVIVQGDEWTTDIATVEGELPDGRPSHWNVASVNRRRDEWAQNRRLIAAAPDSHAACVAMCAALDEAFGINATHDDERIYDELPSSGVARAYFMARAAIAKTTQP